MNSCSKSTTWERVNPDTFTNYAPFSLYFEALDIYRHKGTYLVCPAGQDPQDTYIQAGDKEYINGWFYGAVQAICGNPRKNLNQYPELAKYDQEEHQFDMDRGDDDTPLEGLNRYEIVFEVSGVRYYCFADAVNMDEALGQFFRQHPNIQYNMVLEHMEV